MPAWVKNLSTPAGILPFIYFFSISLKPFLAKEVPPSFRAKFALSSMMNLGNVENFRLSPFSTIYADMNPNWENSLSIKFPINQLIWNGMGESQKISALDSSFSTTYNFSRKFSSTASVNYCRGTLNYTRYGFGLDFLFEMNEKISFSSFFNYERASFYFNDILVRQNSLSSSFSVLPHLGPDTELEFGLSYSSNYFSTTSSSYTLLRFQGGLQQQIGKHSFGVGASWGFDNSDYFVYGIEGTFQWKVREDLTILNYVQIDYFIYESPQPQKSGKKPPPGSSGRRYNPQSTSDSFISFMWYASASKYLNL